MNESQIKEVKLAWANGEIVQYRLMGEWVDWIFEGKLTLNLPVTVWRVKPKTITINGFEVDKPLQNGVYGELYYIPAIDDEYGFCTAGYFKDDERDAYLFGLGICHATPKAAALHAKALLSLTDGSK